VKNAPLALASATDADRERTDARIVLRALEEPLCRLAENAGLEGSVVVNDVRKAKKDREERPHDRGDRRGAAEEGRRSCRWRDAGHVGDDVGRRFIGLTYAVAERARSRARQMSALLFQWRSALSCDQAHR